MSLTLRQHQHLFKKLVEANRISDFQIRSLGILEPLDGASATVRLEAYRYAYFARILESLEEDFPKLQKKLGKNKFRALARRYLAKHPSRYASLAEVGENLPHFLRRNKILASLAELDWARVQAWLAPEPKVSSLGELTQLLARTDGSRAEQRVVAKTVNKLQLELHPSTRVLRKFTLVYRNSEGRVLTIKLKPVETEIFELIVNGKSLGQITRYFERKKTNPKLLNGIFSKWAKNGVIV